LCIGDGNTPINQNFAVLDTLSPGAFLGEIDRNWTSTAGYGGTIQATNTNQIFRHDNHVVLGVSADHGRTQFNGNSELGTIDQNLFVTGQGVFTDQPAADLTPVGLLALNTYTGIYATETRLRRNVVYPDDQRTGVWAAWEQCWEALLSDADTPLPCLG
jgi:iron complex outermembrane receptor protein